MIEEQDILAYSLHIRVVLHDFVVLQLRIEDGSVKENINDDNPVAERGPYRMWWEIVGRMRRWTLICDMGNPLSARRSIRERSNLYNSLPRSLSMDKATEQNVNTESRRRNAEITDSMSPHLVSTAWDPRYKRDVGLGFVSEEPVEDRTPGELTGIDQGSKNMCLKHLTRFFDHKDSWLDTL